MPSVPRVADRGDRVLVGDGPVQAADRRAAEAEAGHPQSRSAERDPLEGLVRHGLLAAAVSAPSSQVDGVPSAGVSFNQSATGQYTEQERGLRLISVRAGGTSILGVQAGERWLPAVDARARRALDDGRAARRRHRRARDAALGGGRGPRPDRERRAPCRRGGPPRPGPAAGQGRRDRAQLPRPHERGGRRRPVRAADLLQVVELGRRARGRDPMGSGAHGAGRLRGGARRRHRTDRAPGHRGRGARPRPRLHLPRRRLGAGPPVRRRPVDPRQVARHVLPDGPGAGHGRRGPRPAGAGDRVPRERRGHAAGDHGRHVLRRRGDHQPLLAGVHPRARRRHRHRDAGRRRDLPRPAGPARGRRRRHGVDRGHRAAREPCRHEVGTAAAAVAATGVASA